MQLNIVTKCITLNFIRHDVSSFKIIIVQTKEQFLIFILKIGTTLTISLKILTIIV